ncbi:MAG: helix-turn-helix domain-containing protein [Wenzhouxiangella sp.]
MPSPPEPTALAHVPASYLVDMAARLLPDREQLNQLLALAGASLDPDESDTLSLAQLLGAIAWLDAQLPRGWHIRASLQLEASQHGAAGLAVITAPTVDQALSTLVSFESLRAPWSILQRQQSAGQAWLITSGHLPADGPRELLLEMTVLAQFSLLGQLGPSVRSQLRIVLPRRYRPWQTQLTEALGANLALNGTQHRIGLPASCLGLPCLLRDRDLHRMAWQRCQGDLLERQGLGPLSQQIYQRLMASNAQVPGLDQLAAELGLSARTLTRRLNDEGQGWRALRDRALSLLAAAALRDSREPIGRIAERLGYADPANFNRACHRWWGRGPGDYRLHGPGPTIR